MSAPPGSSAVAGAAPGDSPVVDSLQWLQQPLEAGRIGATPAELSQEALHGASGASSSVRPGGVIALEQQQAAWVMGREQGAVVAPAASARLALLSAVQSLLFGGAGQLEVGEEHTGASP